MRRPAPTADGDKHLWTFTTANATLIAWLVFLGFGSAFLAFYYSHIHYFPELAWEESFSYLAACSLFGGGAVAVYGLLLFVPGWIWSEFVIFDAKLVAKQTLSYKVDGKKPIQPCFWSISRHLVAPFAAMMVALHLALYSGNAGLSLFTAFTGVLFIARWSHRLFAKALAGVRRDRTTGSFHSFLWKFVAATSCAALAAIIALFFLAHLVDPAGESALLLTVCTLGVVVTNLLVAVQFRQRPASALVTSVVAALALMICGETFAQPGRSQSERIMSQFGIGERSAVRLELTAEDAARLRFANPRHRDVAMLSRLGEEYLVGVMDTSAKSRRIALKKEMVRSWTSVGTATDKRATTWPASPWQPMAALLDLLLVAAAFVWMADHLPVVRFRKRGRVVRVSWQPLPADRRTRRSLQSRTQRPQRPSRSQRQDHEDSSRSASFA